VDFNTDFDADEEIVQPNDHYSSHPLSEYGWIYITADIRDMTISKIGLTTKKTPNKGLPKEKPTIHLSYFLQRTISRGAHMEFPNLNSRILKVISIGDLLANRSYT